MSKSFETKKRAEEWITKTQREVDLGIWAPESDTTFAEWVETYQERREESKRETTKQRDAGALRKWWLPHLGTLRLTAITAKDVRKVVGLMKREGLSPKTIRTYVGVLRAVLNAAIEEELLRKSPLRGVELPKDQRVKEIRFLTVDELERLASAIKPEYRATIDLAGRLGLRFGEIAGLRPCDVDFDAGVVSVVQNLTDVDGKLFLGPPKTEAGTRIIRVGPSTMARLAEHAERFPGEAFFVERPDGRPLIRRTFMRWAFRPAVERAGLEGLTFHHLRHTAVGFMIEDDAHPRAIQQRVGHSSSRVTMDVYGKYLSTADERLANRLDERFG
ncbi:MAG: tyrosine-type recombinase/integrase [Acidimicrobiales bacterium]